jgi:hypothetical protein
VEKCKSKLSQVATLQSMGLFVDSDQSLSNNVLVEIATLIYKLNKLCQVACVVH